jgi:hypothetical protein
VSASGPVSHRRARGSRQLQLQVRLSEPEREQLRARAGELGVSVPRLLVESALAGRETSTERREMLAEVFELRRLVATVANNVNQLAKVANVSGQVPERDQLTVTLTELGELMGRLRDLTGAFR